VARLLDRNDVVDYQTYEDEREAFRRRVMEVKDTRRVHVGDHLTFLFENHDTIRYQVQEMMRAERIVREDAIRHEIDTYNGLLGTGGAVGCSLLIEIDDPAERRGKLEAWLDLPGHLYLKFEDGTKAYAEYDREQVGDDRLSAVQYLRFPAGGRTPVAVGTDFAPLAAETVFTPEQRAALESDLLEG